MRHCAGCIINGFRLHKSPFDNRKTQNCGVMVGGDNSSDKEYIGVLKDKYELHYSGRNRVFAFKCDWFGVQHLCRGYKVDEYGLISINKSGYLKWLRFLF